MEQDDDVNVGVVFIDVEHVENCHGGADGELLSVCEGRKDVTVPFLVDYQRAVPLVCFVPAVDLVVTDQLGVHTGAVVTTEVTGLLHCQVEVERSVLRLSGVRAVVCRDCPQVLPHRHSQSLVDVSPCLVCELVSYLPAPPLLGVGQLRPVDAHQQVRAD